MDAVLIDTAGRLHTKVGLMDELGKVKRVIQRHGPIDETLLVLDATTGQNGLTQARVFTEVAEVTGVVLTKLDGSAKGGIVISVQRELGVPVKLVGLGEGADDLAPFDPAQFVDAARSAERAGTSTSDQTADTIRNGAKGSPHVKALFKAAPGPGFELTDRPEPDPGPADVKIRVLRTGLCGTDLHIEHWDDWAARRVRTPADPRARVLRRGRRGRRGRSTTSRSASGSPARATSSAAPAATAGPAAGRCASAHSASACNRDGAFADYVVIPASNVWVQPATSTPTSARSSTRSATRCTPRCSFPLVGEDVLITGAGPIGVMAAAIARHVGARYVVVTDVSPTRLELARRMGADLAVNVRATSSPRPSASWACGRASTSGWRCPGMPTALQDMIANMNHGGRVAMLGLPNDPFAIDWGRVITHMITIKGIYGREMYDTWYAMSSMLQSGERCGTRSLGRSPTASRPSTGRRRFAARASGKCGKVVLDWTDVWTEHR